MKFVDKFAFEIVGIIWLSIPILAHYGKNWEPKKIYRNRRVS